MDAEWTGECRGAWARQEAAPYGPIHRGRKTQVTNYPQSTMQQRVVDGAKLIPPKKEEFLSLCHLLLPWSLEDLVQQPHPPRLGCPQVVP